MTRATVFFSGGKINGFEIKGHSGYAEQGSDIVCAAVSAISQTALIGLMEVLKLDIDYQIDNKGFLMANLPNDAPNDAQVILNTMLAGLENIQQQHPKNLRVMHSERR